MKKLNIDRLHELRDKGLTYQAIGDMVGLSKQRVHQLLTGYASKRNGLLYNYIREFILERDNHQCVNCGKKDNLHIHHIDGNCHNTKYSNLVALCQKCHKNRPKL